MQVPVLPANITRSKLGTATKSEKRYPPGVFWGSGKSARRPEADIASMCDFVAFAREIVIINSSTRVDTRNSERCSPSGQLVAERDCFHRIDIKYSWEVAKRIKTSKSRRDKTRAPKIRTRKIATGARGNVTSSSPLVEVSLENWRPISAIDTKYSARA